MNIVHSIAPGVLLLTMAGCSRAHPDAPAPAAPSAILSPAAVAADTGKPAPDFALKDLDGRDVRLAEWRGKIVVLEWFNPQCPFVNMAHSKGSLRDAAARHIAPGGVWLGVDSAAPGK